MFHAVSGTLCCNLPEDADEQCAAEFLAEAEAAEEAAEAEEPRILQTQLALKRGRFVER